MSPRQRRYKLLLDEMFPRRESFPVLNKTHDVRHIVHDLRKSGAKDEAVLGIAKKSGRILVTKNIKNFQQKCKAYRVDVFGVTEAIPFEELDKAIMGRLRRREGTRMVGRFTKIVRAPRKI